MGAAGLRRSGIGLARQEGEGPIVPAAKNGDPAPSEGAARLPPHAHVPGRTPRHAESVFAATRSSAVAGMSVEALAASEAFRDGLLFLERGFFWEAHEVLEAVWMALPPDRPERRFVQGLIQLANGWLKLRMDRPKATLRLSGLARDLVASADGGSIMGVDRSGILDAIDRMESDAISALKCRN
jgi:hypothetical protein